MRIVYIGAGNVAHHLAPALQAAGNEIVQIYSRTEASAQLLAQQVGCLYTTDLSEVVSDAALYLFSVKDDVLPELIAALPKNNGIWVHTAGSISISVFKDKCDRYGVLYPLQTFSRDKAVKIAEVPFFIEGSSPTVEKSLFSAAREISPLCHRADSEQRKYIHLAAVFACNFSNLMYQIAARLLADHQLPFEALLPLIAETAGKLNMLSAAEAQTGPAIRWDKSVMNKHLELLQELPQEASVYESLSQLIYSYHQKREAEKRDEQDRL